MRENLQPEPGRARAWKNGYGEVFWQPVEAIGYGYWYKYWHTDTASGRNRVWSGGGDDPVLYKSRKRAERKAARRNRRVLKSSLSRVVVAEEAE